VKLPTHRAGLPGNVDMITGSAFLPAYKAGHPVDLPVRLGVEPHGLKPVAPPHASESGTLRSILSTTLLLSFEGYPLCIHPRSEGPWLSA